MSLKSLSDLDKNNLHHAYLIEGERDEIIPEILEFMKILGVSTSNNPDFQRISVDSFKIKDTRGLKALTTQKGFSYGKKIFLISANSFLLEAQNALLKMFEEPMENTHFFLIVPDSSSLLQTFVSRFYLIRSGNYENDLREAKKFIAMTLPQRIDFVKELLADSAAETDDGENEEEAVPVGDSARMKALKFLNSLEFALHGKMPKNTEFFTQIFKVREFLRMPGSSPKTLLESVALTIPNF